MEIATKFLVLTCPRCWQNLIYLPDLHQEARLCSHCGEKIRLWDKGPHPKPEVHPL